MSYITWDAVFSSSQCTAKPYHCYHLHARSGRIGTSLVRKSRGREKKKKPGRNRVKARKHKHSQMQGVLEFTPFERVRAAFSTNFLVCIFLLRLVLILLSVRAQLDFLGDMTGVRSGTLLWNRMTWRRGLLRQRSTNLGVEEPSLRRVYRKHAEYDKDFKDSESHIFGTNRGGLTESQARGASSRQLVVLLLCVCVCVCWEDCGVTNAANIQIITLNFGAHSTHDI